MPSVRDGVSYSFSQQHNLHSTQARATGRPFARRRVVHMIQRFLFPVNRLLHFLQQKLIILLNVTHLPVGW